MVENEAEGIWILRSNQTITVWTQDHYWDSRNDSKTLRRGQTKSLMKGWGHRFVAPKEMSIW